MSSTYPHGIHTYSHNCRKNTFPVTIGWIVPLSASHHNNPGKRGCSSSGHPLLTGADSRGGLLKDWYKTLHFGVLLSCHQHCQQCLYCSCLVYHRVATMVPWPLVYKPQSNVISGCLETHWTHNCMWMDTVGLLSVTTDSLLALWLVCC